MEDNSEVKPVVTTTKRQKGDPRDDDFIVKYEKSNF